MTKETAAAAAAAAFAARDREIIALDFRGVGNEAEINARYGYSHGWIGGFNYEAATGEWQPRFPADQGTSD